MLEYVNIDVLANWVDMLRAEADGAIWLVDDEDEAAFYQRCAHQEARIIPAPDLAIQLLDLLEARGMEGLVATVRSAEIATPARANVFRPSSGSIASLLLLSKNCCDAVITDIFGTAWLLACDKQIGPIRSRVMSIAHVLDEIRRACLQENVPPPGVECIDEFIQWGTLEFSWDEVRSHLTGKRLPIEYADQIQSTVGLVSPDACVLQCDGMDAIRVLASATKLFRPRGIKAQRQVSVQDLTGMLRLAFDLGELEGDKIFWQMKRWEWNNQQYPLLCEWRTLDPLGVLLDQRYWSGSRPHSAIIRAKRKASGV